MLNHTGSRTPGRPPACGISSLVPPPSTLRWAVVAKVWAHLLAPFFVRPRIKIQAWRLAVGNFDRNDCTADSTLPDITVVGMAHVRSIGVHRVFADGERNLLPDDGMDFRRQAGF